MGVLGKFRMLLSPRGEYLTSVSAYECHVSMSDMGHEGVLKSLDFSSISDLLQDTNSTHISAQAHARACLIEELVPEGASARISKYFFNTPSLRQ